MPEIFTKKKFTVIEYGSQQQGLESLVEIKDKVSDLLSRMIRK